MSQLSGDWQRLAEYVIARRGALDNMTQADVQAAGGPSPATLRNIEGALQTSYKLRVISALERALRWAPGSVKAILAGREPTSASEPPARAAEPPEPELPTTPRELAEHIERRLVEQEERQDAKMAKITEALRSVLGDAATEKLLQTLEEPLPEEPVTDDRRRDVAG